MIQSGTFLNVIDNSGAKKVFCIKVLSGYEKKYAVIGDIILVSIKNLRSKRKANSKVKKGELFRAVIVYLKNKLSKKSNESISFFDNSVVILNKQNKIVASRILGPIPKSFRYTKFFKMVSLSSGLIN